MKRIQVHSKIIIVTLFLIGFQTFLMYGQDSQETPTTEIKVESKDKESKTEDHSKPTTKPKTADNKAKLDAKAKVEAATKAIIKQLPSKTTLFVNGRVNNILLVITDDKNKQFKIYVKAGTHYECGHKAQSLKKVVCYEIHTPNTTLSQADLNNYSAFVFNTDQKLEKHHFISIKQKNHALKHARETHNKTLFDEISEQTIYNP